jgi:methionyl-tRNA formyltransferase
MSVGGAGHDGRAGRDGLEAAAPKLRVAFAGTPAFAAAALGAIGDAGHTVCGVWTQPDRPAGRGLALQASEVKQLALARGWPIGQPRGLRLDGRWADDARAAREQLAGWTPDVMVVAAYGLILPAWVLALPRLGCLNIHASLLPRWRGAAPIHRAIEAGDAETGITLMQMDEGLDTGAMRLVQRLAIGPAETTGELHDRLAALGARLVVQGLARLADPSRGSLPLVAQAADGITYAHKIDKAEARIDWTQPAAVIERRVRAFSPAPGATTAWAGESLKLWRADVVSASPSDGAAQAQPGTVLAASSSGPSAGLTVACGEGALRVLELQRAGGRRMPAAAALAGLRLGVGDRLG